MAGVSAGCQKLHGRLPRLEGASILIMIFPEIVLWLPSTLK